MRFLLLRRPYTYIIAHLRINDLTSLDINAACFMMLTMNVPSLFGIMTRPAKIVIRIKDSPKIVN